MGDRWYEVGTEWIGSNPPIYTFETVLGDDLEGREWRARAKWKNGTAWQVWFDHMDGEMPFLRDEVVYADSYWKAMRERHELANCNYSDIMNIIKRFMSKHNITEK